MDGFYYVTNDVSFLHAYANVTCQVGIEVLEPRDTRRVTKRVQYLSYDLVIC